MRPQDFYTKSRASLGVRVELIDPAGNKEWVRVRSIASDEFRQAAREALLRAAREGKGIGGDPAERKRQLRRRRAELAAALIADWSLPMTADTERADLLMINPRLRRGIERVAENHSLHFGVRHD